MPGKAAKTLITERQQEILRTFSRSVTGPSRLRQRASIIILAFDGLLNEDIAQLSERAGEARARTRRSRRSSPTNPVPAPPPSSPPSR